MAFWTYILRCCDGRYYTGHTDDLERRIGEHQTGGYRDFTARRRPIELVWSQDFGTRDEAPMRGDWMALSHIAKPLSKRVSTSLDTNGSIRKS